MIATKPTVDPKAVAAIVIVLIGCAYVFWLMNLNDREKEIAAARMRVLDAQLAAMRAVIRPLPYV